MSEETPQVPVAPPTAPTQEDRTMAMLAHILGIFTWFVGCLVIWLIKKDQSEFVNDQAGEALNFQITLAIAWAVIWVMATSVIGLVLLPLLPVIWIVNLIFSIMGAVAANNGTLYRYPFALRLIK